MLWVKLNLLQETDITYVVSQSDNGITVSWDESLQTNSTSRKKRSADPSQLVPDKFVFYMTNIFKLERSL